MKRSIVENNVNLNFGSDINPAFLQECEKTFYDDPNNITSRNSVVAMGSMLATMDSNRVNEINHIFMNTIKKKNLKATNQGRSGRCWMFSGLNMFRHSVIKALDLDNFEFSETYLFFYDKLERANRYLRWFINHPDVEIEDDAFKFMVDDYTGDGGWWNMFSNLVMKYGLVPKSAMKETFQSDDSDDMNQILNDCLQSCVNFIRNNKNLSDEDIEKIRIETIKQIYNILVKFLGEPPKKFRWAYTNDEDQSTIISDLNPISFKNMVLPGVDLRDFVVLTHLPGKLRERKVYEIKYTSNVYEGDNFKFLNLSMKELSKYTSKSILSGFPVWFAADVSKDFNPYHSVLDDKLSAHENIFGQNYDFSKSDKISFRNLQANHAMSLLGINFGPDSKPESWQVENSWGFFDHETPGEDGFLYMSNSWFEQNVMQVVIHKEYLTRSVKKLLDQDPIQLDPWDCVAPALRAGAIDAPKFYNPTCNSNKRKRFK
jgi:bleomycin hydrolase